MFKFALSSSASYFTFLIWKFQHTQSRGVSWTPGTHHSATMITNFWQWFYLARSLEGDDSLSSDHRAVVLHDSKTKKYDLQSGTRKRNCSFHMGFRALSVDGFRKEVAAVQGHAQHVDLDTRAPRAVTRHTFCPETTWGEESIKVTGVAKETDVTTEPHCFLCRERQRTFWNGPSKWLTRLLKKRARDWNHGKLHDWNHGKVYFVNSIHLTITFQLSIYWNIFSKSHN